MSDLLINTDLVVNTASTVSEINGQIRADFDRVQAAVNQLDLGWDGEAATQAIGKFNEIKNNYVDARYDVINNYVNFLLQQVGQGHEQTESVNVSLADAFK